MDSVRYERFRNWPSLDSAKALPYIFHDRFFYSMETFEFRRARMESGKDL